MSPSGQPAPALAPAALAPAALAPAALEPAPAAPVPELALAPAAPAHQHQVWHLKQGRKLRKDKSKTHQNSVSSELYEKSEMTTGTGSIPRPAIIADMSLTAVENINCLGVAMGFL